MLVECGGCAQEEIGVLFHGAFQQLDQLFLQGLPEDEDGGGGAVILDVPAHGSLIIRGVGQRHDRCGEVLDQTVHPVKM